eukprot:scaffold22381_cov118-Isochrysis_galbana.AAC.7
MAMWAVFNLLPPCLACTGHQPASAVQEQHCMPLCDLALTPWQAYAISSPSPPAGKLRTPSGHPDPFRQGPGEAECASARTAGRPIVPGSRRRRR